MLRKIGVGIVAAVLAVSVSVPPTVAVAVEAAELGNANGDLGSASEEGPLEDFLTGEEDGSSAEENASKPVSQGGASTDGLEDDLSFEEAVDEENGIPWVENGEGAAEIEEEGNFAVSEGEGFDDASDGWVQQGDSRYYIIDGVAVKGSLCIDGSWYRFDVSDGRMLTEWQSFDGKTYYYDPESGALTFRNRCIDGDWYWFDLTEGYMWTGSAYIDGAWYRYDLVDGRMLHGSQWIDGAWYRYDLVDGRMKHGWQDIDGHRYYYGPLDGKMRFGKQVIDGGNYRFHARQGYEVPYFRVYLDAGHGWNSSSSGQWDPGSLGVGGVEADLTAALVNDVAARCREKYGIEVVTHTDSSSVWYRKRQNQAVDEGCSTLVSVHFNAGGGSGYESYIHSYNSPEGSGAVQAIMHRHLGAGIGLKDRGMLRSELAVVGGYLPSTLLEICFIDNSFDMNAFREKRDRIVDELADGIYEMSLTDACIGSGF